MSTPCKHCGCTKRYASNGKCVGCVSIRGKARHAARIERRGNYHAGLKDGFIRFGTLAHRILRYIHDTGPAQHAELVEVMEGERGLSANLGRLVTHGFLYRTGRQSYKPGTRSGCVFSLEAPRAALQPANTHVENQARYRAALKLKVPSVFDFRGRISL